MILKNDFATHVEVTWSEKSSLIGLSQSSKNLLLLLDLWWIWKDGIYAVAHKPYINHFMLNSLQSSNPVWISLLYTKFPESKALSEDTDNTSNNNGSFILTCSFLKCFLFWTNLQVLCDLKYFDHNKSLIVGSFSEILELFLVKYTTCKSSSIQRPWDRSERNPAVVFPNHSLSTWIKILFISPFFFVNDIFL